MNPYDDILRRNLQKVFSERDAERRLHAIRELYAEDAVLFEPEAVVTGHAAISQAVDALLESLPQNVLFSALAPAFGHHGVGMLRWQSGPANGPVLMTGTDVARIEDGQILTLHVFLDLPSG